MNFDWSVLVQIPIVAAFIFFSMKMQSFYQESVAKRDEAYISALEKIADDVKENTKATRELCTYIRTKGEDE